MSVANKLLQAAAGNAGGDAVYVDDVFNIHLWRGADEYETIHNGISLADHPTDFTSLHLTGDSIADSAPIANTISNTSVTVSSSVKKYGTGSMLFGSNKHLEISGDNQPKGNEDFTIEAWVYVTSQTNYNYIYSASHPIQFFINSSASLQLYLNDNDDSSTYIASLNGGTVPTNQWAHVAATRNGNTVNIWINGSSVDSDTISVPDGVQKATTYTPRVGAWGGGSYFFNGYIDDFRITRGKCRYTESFTPPSEALPIDTLTTGEGGLVWIKSRTDTTNHYWFDTERGAPYYISTSSTGSQTNDTDSLVKFRDGFEIDDDTRLNDDNEYFVAWTFRKQPGFFDVVTYTGNGTAGNTVSHNLGSTPGMIVVKRTDSSGNFIVYHRSLDATNPEDKYLHLSTTQETSDSNTYWNDTAPTSTEFTLGNNTLVNANNGSYVAYLFAHDEQDFGTDSDESIIKCGGYTGNGGTKEITLGFEPQWILFKNADDFGNNWMLCDIMRGAPVSDDTEFFEANTTDAEAVGGGTGSKKWWPTATGSTVSAGGGGANDPNENGEDYVYVAIRRPHKPAEEFEATDLFHVETMVNSSSGEDRTVNTGFNVDSLLLKVYDTSSQWYWADRLRGTGNFLSTNSTATEDRNTNNWVKWDTSEAISEDLITWSNDRVYYAFRRAPGFFDIVNYTGTGANRTVSHNLGVAPELMIIKGKSAGYNWQIYSEYLGNTKKLEFTSSAAGVGLWNSTSPTDSVFTVASNNNVNQSSSTYIAYLFASVDGISKVGGFNRPSQVSQDVDCGFTNGARFVLLKRTNTTGQWVLWDSVRGIVAGNDPYLLLNGSNAQITTQDYIDPLPAGFTLTSGILTGDWVFLAIA